MNKFNIVIAGKVFVSNDEGFLNLNDIWRECNLPESKRPNQWRNAVSKSFSETGNLQSGEKQRDVGEVFTNLVIKTLYADEEATIGYAMFVSVDFYRTVIKAFVALRKGDVEKAVALAQTTSIETHSHNKWMNYAETPIRDACGMLNVSHTALFMHLAKKPKQLESFIKRGILKNRNYGKHGSSLRITRLGKAWMKENIETINNTLETIHNKVTL